METVAKFERLNKLIGNPLIPLPQRATPGSAGYDFFLPPAYDVNIRHNEEAVIATGIKCRIEEGWFLMLAPRSGLGFKYQIGMANTIGVIDSDYYNNPNNEGEIVVKIVNRGHQTVRIKGGEAFCQGVFVPYGITEDDAPVNSERIGGFGSTDAQSTANN